MILRQNKGVAETPTDVMALEFVEWEKFQPKDEREKEEMDPNVSAGDIIVANHRSR